MLTRTILTAAIVSALGALPAVADTPAPPRPNFPTLPGLKTARFAVTVVGRQSDAQNFEYDAADGVDCSTEGRGTLAEDWDFRRGRGVVIAFTKLGPGVVVTQRAGRSLGDAAFAVTGGLTREATGSVDARAPIDCVGFPLGTPACGGYGVTSDLNLTWAKGKLVLGPSSTANTQPNPAIKCGQTPVWNFDTLSFPFPLLFKQSGALSLKRLFDSTRSFKVELKDRFIEPADAPAGYKSLHETLKGTTTVTLRRLKR